MLPDIQSTQHLLRSGQTQLLAEIEQAIDMAQSQRCRHVFLKPMFDEARARANTPDIQVKPLSGLPVSNKDLFDVTGQITPAGSIALSDAAPATQDSLAVARLRRAGATFIGRTNMTEFAFSGVGVNPHFGTPANACATDVPRIPGGSSSGAEINQLQQIQATGGFSAAQSYAWHHHLLADKAHNYDPRVAARIQRGATMSACDYIELRQARRTWINTMDTAMQGFDAFLSPTVPIVAPPIAEVAPGVEQDGAFFRINALLLRNTSVINMLDGCAISIPCHAPDELPVGLMVWAGALRDDPVLNIALQIEYLLQKQ